MSLPKSHPCHRCSYPTIKPVYVSDGSTPRNSFYSLCDDCHKDYTMNFLPNRFREWLNRSEDQVKRDKETFDWTIIYKSDGFYSTRPGRGKSDVRYSEENRIFMSDVNDDISIQAYKNTQQGLIKERYFEWVKLINLGFLKEAKEYQDGTTNAIIKEDAQLALEKMK